MTLRRKNVQRIMDIREKTLKERAGVLTHANEGCAIAREQASDAATDLQQAEQYRQQLANAPVDVASWIEAEQWLASRNRQNALAQNRLQGAETLVQQAYDGVIEARSDVKQIEVLDKHLAQQEQRKQTKLEQKRTDEHSQAKFVRQRRIASD